MGLAVAAPVGCINDAGRANSDQCSNGNVGGHRVCEGWNVEAGQNCNRDNNYRDNCHGEHLLAVQCVLLVLRNDFQCWICRYSSGWTWGPVLPNRPPG